MATSGICRPLIWIFSDAGGELQTLDPGFRILDAVVQDDMLRCVLPYAFEISIYELF